MVASLLNFMIADETFRAQGWFDRSDLYAIRLQGMGAEKSVPITVKRSRVVFFFTMGERACYGDSRQKTVSRRTNLGILPKKCSGETRQIICGEWMQRLSLTTREMKQRARVK